MTRLIDERAPLIPPTKCTWKDFFAYYQRRCDEFVSHNGETFIDGNYFDQNAPGGGFPSCKSCGSITGFPVVIYVSKHLSGAITDNLGCGGFGEVKTFCVPVCEICDIIPKDRSLKSCVHDSHEPPRF